MVVRCGNVVAYSVIALLACWAWAPPACSDDVQLIDAHTHLVPDSELNFEQALESAVQMMDRFGVGISIVMSPPRVAGVAQNYDISDFKAALDHYPGRFVFLGGGGTLNPMVHEHPDPLKVRAQHLGKFIRQAEHLIDNGAFGFGEMAGLHVSLSSRHRYSFVQVNHPMLLALAKLAAHRDVPIDLHMDAVASEMPLPVELARLPNNPKTLPGTLTALDKLLAHNPKTKIVWAHGGTDHTGDFSAKTIEDLMDRHANLFLSLKVAGPKARTHNKLFSSSGLAQEWRSLLIRHADRFTIGTDNFYMGSGNKEGGPPAEFSRKALPRLQATKAFLALLPPELARQIARDNAARLYRLPTEKVTAPQSGSGGNSGPKGSQTRGLCRDGNMAHCRTLCDQGRQRACKRLRQGS